MLTFLQKQFLPVGLVFVALVGLSIPEPGIYMATLPTQYVAVSIIFFVFDVNNDDSLSYEEFFNALKTWK